MLPIPYEIIMERIFAFITPDEITSCLQICKEMRDLVKQNGKYIYSICSHIQPHGIKEVFHNNKKLFTRYEYKDGKKFGICKTWYSCGSIRTYAPYKKGKRDGTSFIYYCGQRIMTESNHQNGYKHGRQLHYTTSGMLFREEHYRDGIKTGKHRFWDKIIGELKEEVEYRGGFGKNTYLSSPVTYDKYSFVVAQTKLNMS